MKRTRIKGEETYLSECFLTPNTDRSFRSAFIPPRSLGVFTPSSSRLLPCCLHASSHTRSKCWNVVKPWCFVGIVDRICSLAGFQLENWRVEEQDGSDAFAIFKWLWSAHSLELLNHSIKRIDPYWWALFFLPSALRYTQVHTCMVFFTWGYSMRMCVTDDSALNAEVKSLSNSSDTLTNWHE